MSPTSSAGQPGLRLSAVAALIVSALLVGLSLMVIVPPFTLLLFRLAVGALEYSPLLVLADLLWCLPANRLLRGHRRLRYATLGLLVVAACIAVWPLTTYTRVASAASAQLGTDEGPPRFSLVALITGLPTSPDVEARTIPYAAADGQRLTMRLYSLPPHQQRPTVVVLYGGAWQAGSPAQSENVSRALASRGYTVAAIDYRHAPASHFPAQIDDVNYGIVLLRDSSAQWGIDVHRMALLGRSSGGQLAELAAWSQNDYGLRAVVALYAPFDLTKGYNAPPSPDPLGTRVVLRDYLDGTPETQARRYMAASPSTLVRPGLPPTLLLFGGRDHIVRPVFNREAAAALRAAHVPVVAVELPWAEHAFDMLPTGLGAQLAFNVISAFLDRELKVPEKASAPRS